MGSSMSSMREALQAVGAVLDRVGVPHRPAKATYDGWENLEAQVFKSVIGEPHELSGADPMARYGFSIDSYAGQSFVQVALENVGTAALVRFHSTDESFDSLLCAVLHPETLVVTGSTTVPFSEARFALFASRRDTRQTFEYLSY